MGNPKKDLYEISAISAGKNQTLAVLKSGEVLGWGGAGSGRVTIGYVDICGTRAPSKEPVYIAKPSLYSNICAGYGVSLGVAKQQAYIWGFSQIGIGGKELFTEAPTLIDSISDASKVAAGQLIYAAIDQAGGIYTWGLNVDGALGRTTTQLNALPEKMTDLPPMQEMGVGDNFMVALSKDQRVYAWGSNSAGQLGLGHLHSSPSPEPVALPVPITSIAIGSTHVLAVTTNGAVYGWGSNHIGQLGNNQRPYIDRPMAIAFPEKIKAVAAGMHYSLALAASGKIYAWGWNGFGQLGLGDLKARNTPTLIPSLSGVRAIAAGETHSLAMNKNHFLGWGCNESGQIGKAAVMQATPNIILEIA
jgi:alpha-tubulin suppressor-like RCC1 family protein